MKIKLSCGHYMELPDPVDEEHKEFISRDLMR